MAVNCAAIPESLIESELFGYAPGTFTGGRAKGAKGLIQEADGGTLFLDEIGDMPLHLQSRLLRVLAEGQVLPLGASQPVNIDIRVLAATHCNLTQLIADGRFREDLYYRLNGATLKLPALKARVDKHYLIKLLLQRINPAVRLRADAMSALLAYSWPGNVRQLVNTLTFAEAVCEDGVITVHHLPEECVAGRLDKPAFALPMQSLTPGYSSALASETLSDSVREEDASLSEQQILINILRQHRWNISAVAQQLGVSRPTVYRRMKKLGVSSPRDC